MNERKICQIHKLGIFHRKCSSQEIFLSLMWKGEKIDLCQKCAYRILDSDMEWCEENAKN